MEKVFVLDCLRSHIGLKNGIFKNLRAEEIGSRVLRELVNRNNLTNIDEIICGNSVGTGGNLTRLMMLYAGIDYSIPAFTIDMQCSSANVSLDIGFSKIKSGMSNVVIVGGFESSSTQPTRTYSKNDSRYNGDIPYGVAQFSPGEVGDDVTLVCAQRVAEKMNITKDELDRFTLLSHKRAEEARVSNYLNKYIYSINNSYDEGIRKNISQRLIDRLRPLVKEDGVINSSNSCLINDGASFLILCSEKYIIENNLKPLCEVILTNNIGIDPLYTPVAAIDSIDKILEKANIDKSNVSAFEVNEAFGVIDVLFERRYGSIDKYNIFGGALAYGHPYAASGGIILTHLIAALEKIDGEIGVSSVAAAGGLASSTIIKRIK